MRHDPLATDVSRTIALGIGATLTLLACEDPRLVANLGAEVSPRLVLPGERTECFDVTGALLFERASIIAPRLDPSLAHHVALHRASRAPIDRDCTSIGPATLLYMGSPGDDPLVVPDDHALVLTHDADDVLVLELHYVNATAAPREDTSGLDLVSAPASASHEIGLWTVGDPVLDIPARTRGHVEEKRCTIRTDRPVVLHAVSPHMHARGVAISVTRTRGERDEPIVEVDPFDPLRQRTVTLERALALEPGDRLTLRCVYDNPDAFDVTYGTRLEDEMCFAYVWASPIEALRDDASFCH
ncbi:MAG: hypothetical protein J0L92_20550 [Deltaproteobacteria bacterium]|nr:hypothetical protein [Deltaproteobacteria bacterium]